MEVDMILKKFKSMGENVPVMIVQDKESVLHCPCGSPLLHQGRVIVHDRKDEDADGRIIIVDQESVKDFTASKDRLYGRRNALFIEFACEECGKTYTLKIHQHKGNTLMAWHEGDMMFE